MDESNNESEGDRSIIDTQCLLGNIDTCLANFQPPESINEAVSINMPELNKESQTSAVGFVKNANEITFYGETDETVKQHVELENISNSSKSNQEDKNTPVGNYSKSLESSVALSSIVSSDIDRAESYNSPQETNHNESNPENSQDSSIIAHSGKVISQESNISSQSIQLFSQQTTSQTQAEHSQELKGVDKKICKRKLSSEYVDEDMSKRSKISTNSEDREIPNEDITVSNDDIETENDYSYQINYNFEKEPGQITGAWEGFKDKDNNFIKGCKWSPDGSCLLTNSDDNILRLFNTPSQIYDGSLLDVPEMKSVLKMKVGETIYDYCWYPLMKSSDPESCCLISTSRCMPVHMWDAFTGDLICSYKSYDQADELVAAHSVAFNNEGSKIYCGFTKTIRVFDVSRPGRNFENRKTFVKSVGQPGIISCIKFSPVDSSLYAAGSYSRTIALYYEPQGELACSFTGHQGGVTHILWSPDGTKLYSGARKDGEIICWDLRNPSKVLFTVNRQVETNQRIYFDLDSSGRYLISGNHNGTISVWDVLQVEDTRPKPILSYKAHYDTVNGVSLHPYLPVVATSSGQRHYPVLGDSDDSDTEDLSQTTDLVDNSIGLWWLSS